MKTLSQIVGCIALVVSARNALAADFSVGINNGGLNLYSISQQGVKLVPGSPYMLPLINGYSTVPIMTALNPAHNFLYVVYDNIPGVYPPAVTGTSGILYIVGFKVTQTGLQMQWSLETDPVNLLDLDPFTYLTLVAGTNYVIMGTTPDDTSPHEILMVNELGSVVANNSSGTGEGTSEVISIRVSPGEGQYYFCHNEPINSFNPSIPAVTLYGLASGVFKAPLTAVNPLPTPILTSTDATFVQSVCD